MQRSETNTGPSGPHWGEKEQTVFAPVPLMTGTAPSNTLRSFPLSAISPNMSRLMAEITYHLSWMGRSLGLALALIATASSLKHSRSRSLLPLSRTIRRFILLPFLTSTRSSDTMFILYLSLCGHRCTDHRVHVL